MLSRDKVTVGRVRIAVAAFSLSETTDCVLYGRTVNDQSDSDVNSYSHFEVPS